MKKSKYSEAQIATALRQVEAGALTAEVTYSSDYPKIALKIPILIF